MTNRTYREFIQMLDFRCWISFGKNSSSQSSTTEYHERELNAEELELIRASTTNAQTMTELAVKSDARSDEEYKRYKDVFEKAQDKYISEVDETEFGNADERLRSILSASNKESAQQGSATARRNADKTLASRGISANSGIAVAQQLGISNQQQKNEAMGENDALFKAIEYGDKLKQNKLGNLGSVVGMGSQSFGGASSYNQQAMQGQQGAGALNNQTFSSFIVYM